MDKKDEKINFIYVHGLNTTDPSFSAEWEKAVENIVRSSKLGDNTKTAHFPVKWSSTNWIIDLQNIYMYKSWRDAQIQKVIDQILSCKDGVTCIISHSWGSVWAYKAIMRLSRLNKQPRADNQKLIDKDSIYSIMIGAALGGTNLPGGGPYVSAVINDYKYAKRPEEIRDWFNLYNKDDYVSTRLYIDKMINIRISTGDTRPGLQEHDAMFYINTNQFKDIINQIVSRVRSKSFLS